jgi:hypothetical protein
MPKLKQRVNMTSEQISLFSSNRIRAIGLGGCKPKYTPFCTPWLINEPALAEKAQGNQGFERQGTGHSRPVRHYL